MGGASPTLQDQRTIEILRLLQFSMNRSQSIHGNWRDVREMMQWGGLLSPATEFKDKHSFKHPVAKLTDWLAGHVAELW